MITPYNILRWDGICDGKENAGPNGYSSVEQEALRSKQQRRAPSTLGPEMAKDLTKPRMPAVSFAHASAKEAILQDLEKKKAERQRRLRQIQLDEEAAAEKQRRAKEGAAERESAYTVPGDPVLCMRTV